MSGVINKHLIAWITEDGSYGTNHLNVSFQWKDSDDDDKCVYDHYLSYNERVLGEVILNGFVCDVGPSHLIGLDSAESNAYHPGEGSLRHLLHEAHRINKAISKATQKTGDYSKAAIIFTVLKFLKVKEVRYRKLGSHAIEHIKIGATRDWLVRLVDDIEARWGKSERVA
jgi:hypothetical protein